MTTNVEPAAAAASGQFEQLAPRVGARIHLVLASPGGSIVVNSSLIGYVPHEFLIVKAPIQGLLPLKLRNGECLKVRLFNGVRLAEFDATMVRQFVSPVSYWHLSYPASLRVTTLRAALRAAVSIAARVEVGAGASAEVRIIDLNELGARIVAARALGERDSLLRLDFSLPRSGTGGDPVRIVVPARIKAVRAHQSGNGQDGEQAHGLQFEQLSEPDKLVLQNYVLVQLNDGAASVV